MSTTGEAGRRLLAGITGKRAPDVTKGEAPIVKTRARVAEAPPRKAHPPFMDDVSPFAPHNGTPTSAAAAESLSEGALGRLEKVVMVCFRERSKQFGTIIGMTCDEVERTTGLTHQTCSARVNGLVKKGELTDTGHTRPTRSGRQATIWQAARPIR